MTVNKITASIRETKAFNGNLVSFEFDVYCTRFLGHNFAPRLTHAAALSQ